MDVLKVMSVTLTYLGYAKYMSRANIKNAHREMRIKPDNTL